MKRRGWLIACIALGSLAGCASVGPYEDKLATPYSPEKSELHTSTHRLYVLGQPTRVSIGERVIGSEVRSYSEVTGGGHPPEHRDLNPWTQYEVIFTGLDPQALHFEYREFTPDNMARPAFFQALSYPANARVIRFRDVAIEVLKADAEGLSFQVDRDGLSEAETVVDTSPTDRVPEGDGTPVALAKAGRCVDAKNLAGTLGDPASFQQVELICKGRH